MTAQLQFGWLDFVPEAALIVNDTGAIICANAAFEAELGMPRAHASSLNFWTDFFKARDADDLLAARAAASIPDSRTINFGVFPTLTLKGEAKIPIFTSVDWRCLRIAGDDQLKTCPRYIFTGRRLTPVEADSEEKASEFLDFFENAPIALHWLSGTGTILWANQKELDTLGYTREEYIGHSVLEFCPDETERVLETFKLLGSNTPIHNVPFKFRAKNGDPKYLVIDSNVSLHADGTFKHTRCFIRDDTDRQIKQKAAELEAKHRATEDAARDVFTSRLFHEIRTPLQVIYIPRIS